MKDVVGDNEIMVIFQVTGVAMEEEEVISTATRITITGLITTAGGRLAATEGEEQVVGREGRLRDRKELIEALRTKFTMKPQCRCLALKLSCRVKLLISHRSELVSCASQWAL